MKRFLLVFLFSACPIWAQSKAQTVLTMSGQAAAWSDMVSTEKLIHPQFRRDAGGVIVVSPVIPESDPLAMPFTRLPKADYYLTGTIMAASLTYLGNGMKKSRHRWERKIWWVPQVAQIALNAGFAAQNSLLLSRR